MQHPDMQPIVKILQRLSLLPFELNMKVPQEMQLQITETFEISYFDNSDHKFIKMKADNLDILNEKDWLDTGVKISAFFIINDDLKGES